MRRLVPWLVLLAHLFVVAPALAAARKPLLVLNLQSDDALPQAQALTLALKRAVPESPRYELARGEFSLEVLSLALGCSDPPDGTCLARIGAKTRAAQFVWGTVRRDGRNVIAHLRLWRRGAAGSETSARYSASLTDPRDARLTSLAESLLARLSGESAALSEAESAAESGDLELRGGKDAEVTSKLLVLAGQLDGQVVIDGRPYGRIEDGRAELDVPPGEHEVVVRASGYYEAVGRVVVEPGRTARVRLEPEPRGKVRDSGALREGSGSTGAGVGAIVVGAALVGGGVYSAIRVDRVNDDPKFAGYRSTFRQNQNACVEAENGTVVSGQAPPSEIDDLCQEARTFEALQYIFFGLGGVAIGTGVLILLADAPSAASASRGKPATAALDLQPRVSIGRGSAELGLRLGF